MSHLPDEPLEDTLLPPSHSFISHSFDSFSIQRPPPSHPPPLHNASAWPVSYQVHTLERRGRPTRPSPLNFLTPDSQPNDTAPIPASAPSTSNPTPAREIPNPFASAPSTPGASVRSFASSSSGSLPAILPPVPRTPPPNPPSPRIASHSYATVVPAIIHNDPPTPTQNHPGPSTVHHRRTRSRTAHERERRHSHAAPAVHLTPPATAVGERDISERDGEIGGGAWADRTSIRDTFSSPPVLVTLPTATGSSTPSTRPPSSKQSGSGVNAWKIQGALGGDVTGSGEKTDSLDFSGVTDSLRAMQRMSGGHVRDEGFASESISSISMPFGYGAIGGPGKVGEDGDSVVLRPSKLLQGEISKPWLKEVDWRISASWWITVVSFCLDCYPYFVIFFIL
jgi:hypothetical protein